MSSQGNRKGKKPGRKQPITIEAIVGMLESSARLDGVAAKKRKDEAGEFGRPARDQMNWRGRPRETIDVTGGYSIGILISAQILAGQAAELALKYAYESENPRVSAPRGHELNASYERLSRDKKAQIEEDYALRVQRHENPPGKGWETTEQVFRSGKDYPVLFRYCTEEGHEPFYAEPVFLREAVCSVLASIGAKVNWSAQ